MATEQSPIPSGFGAATTAAELIREIDLKSKIVIVTVGYSGLGLKTARALVSVGGKVVVPARSREKAAKALKHRAHCRGTHSRREFQLNESEARYPNVRRPMPAKGDEPGKKTSLPEVNDAYAALKDGSLTRVVVTSF